MVVEEKNHDCELFFRLHTVLDDEVFRLEALQVISVWHIHYTCNIRGSDMTRTRETENYNC